jgi:penicillin-binding protein 1A
VASDVDLRSSEADGTTDVGAAIASDEPTVSFRPLDRGRPWQQLALAIVATAIGLASALVRLGGQIAAAAAQAWPPARRGLVRAAAGAARIAVAAGRSVRALTRRVWMWTRRKTPIVAARVLALVSAIRDEVCRRWPVVAAASRSAVRAAGRSARAASRRGWTWAQHWTPIVAGRVAASARALGADARLRWPAIAAALRTAAHATVVTLASAADALGTRGRQWLTDRARRDRLDDGPRLSPARAARAALSGVTIVALLGTTAAVGGRLAVSAVAAGVASGDPAVVALPALAQRSELFAADGSSLGIVHADHGNRVVVPLDAVPKVLVDAVLATEDADFWNHDGIDMSGVARAAKRNIAVGGVAQGGSTITQQLAKSTLPSPKRDLRRKATEAILALRLEDQLGKRGVLERYLNTIYFGHGAYGVAAAAEAYFGRPLAELTVDQAALLAGLIRGPNLYDPLIKPDAARARRSTVLGQMVTQGFLTPADAELASAAPIPTEVQRPAPAVGWVADAARAELLNDSRLGDTRKARAAALTSGGLRVHTTVDPGLQREAEAAVSGGVPRGTDLTAALASVDPATGAVRALVGGTDYTARQFNAATDGAGRQTGSAFKVFTLVAALQAGHVSSEAVDGNSPCPIPNPGGKPNPWLPDNYEGEAFGQLSLVDATVHSSNCAYARLASSVGVARVADVAAEMGITAPLQKVPSMTLGTNTVPPLQMAAAYATLAADGVARTPHVVERVERADGSVVFANDGGPRQVLDPQVARVASAVLSEVVARGTGRAATLDDRPVAGKTGTAQNHQDAWFVGYTPQLATAVWMGDVNGERPMLNIGGINVTGGSYPARIWREFMMAAHGALPVVAFTVPAPEPPPTTAPVAATSPPAPSTPKARSPKGAKGKGKG